MPVLLDLFAGTVRSGEKQGQQGSEVARSGQKWSEVVSSKINKLWNVMTLSRLLFPGD